MNIPTAEEFSNKYNMTSKNGFPTAIKLAKEFARLHVEAAKEEITKKACLRSVICDDWQGYGTPEHITEIDKNSILDAYPLENIK